MLGGGGRALSAFGLSEEPVLGFGGGVWDLSLFSLSSPLRYRLAFETRFITVRLLVNLFEISASLGLLVRMVASCIHVAASLKAFSVSSVIPATFSMEDASSVASCCKFSHLDF